MEKSETENNKCDELLARISEQHMNRLEDKIDNLGKELKKISDGFIRLDTNFDYAEKHIHKLRNSEIGFNLKLTELENKIFEIEKFKKELENSKSKISDAKWTVATRIIGSVLGVTAIAILTLCIEHIKNLF